MGIQIKEKSDETVTKWVQAALSQDGPMTSNDLYFKINPGVSLQEFRLLVYNMVRTGEISKKGHSYMHTPVHYPPATRSQITEAVGRMVMALAGRLPEIMFANLSAGGGHFGISAGMRSPFKLLCRIDINVDKPAIDTKQLASLVEWVGRIVDSDSIYPLPNCETKNPTDGLFHTLYY